MYYKTCREQAHEVTFPLKHIYLYESKPNFIKSFGLRILPLLESASINSNNIDKNSTLNLPTWCINKPKFNFDLQNIENYTLQATHRWRKRLTHTCYAEKLT